MPPYSSLPGRIGNKRMGPLADISSRFAHRLEESRSRHFEKLCKFRFSGRQCVTAVAVRDPKKPKHPSELSRSSVSGKLMKQINLVTVFSKVDTQCMDRLRAGDDGFSMISLVTYYSIPRKLTTSNDSWKIMDNFMRGVNRFEISLYDHQKEMFLWIASSLVRKVFGVSADDMAEQICQRLGFKKLSDVIIMLASRRSGKTTVFEIVGILVLVFIPRSCVLLAANNLKICVTIVRQMMGMINRDPFFKSFLIGPDSHSAQRLIFTNPFDHNDVRTLQVTTPENVSSRFYLFTSATPPTS